MGYFKTTVKAGATIEDYKKLHKKDRNKGKGE